MPSVDIPSPSLLESYDGVRCVRDTPLAQSLVCTGCGSLLKDAVQSSCGCRYCAKCFEEQITVVSSHRPTPVAPECTFCKTPINPETSFPDMCARRDVSALTVKCRESDQGCGWQGELLNHQAHFAVCPFSLVTCDLPGCTASVQRRHLAEHKVTECEGRHVACEHCGDDVIASGMSHHVAEECQRVTVPCPNACETTDLFRAEVTSHLKDCPRQNVHCYYAGVGCEFHDERQTLPAHHDSTAAYHMQLIYQVANAAKKSVNELRQEVTELKCKNSRLSKRVSELDQEVSELKAGNVRVLEQVPALGEVNPLTDGSPTSEVDSQDEVSGVAASPLVPPAAAQMPSPPPGPTGGVQLGARVSDLSVRQACLEVEIVDLDLRQDLMEVQGSNGVLIWRISNIRRRVAEAERGNHLSLYSPPFYSSGGTTGYKMCVRIYLNGDGAGMGTCVSLFFVVMRGDYDALMLWPFQHMVKFSLLDQGGGKKPKHIVETFRPDVTSSSFHRPTADMNIATGCPRFAPKSCLQSSASRYIRDDSIFLRADVPVVGPL